MRHELKTWPEPFQAIVDRLKRYEVRKADRPFRVGDELLLREFIPIDALGHQVCSGYTGREVLARITYVTQPGAWGMPDDLCVLGLGDWTELTETNGQEAASAPPGDERGRGGGEGGVKVIGNPATPGSLLGRLEEDLEREALEMAGMKARSFEPIPIGGSPLGPVPSLRIERQPPPGVAAVGAVDGRRQGMVMKVRLE